MELFEKDANLNLFLSFEIVAMGDGADAGNCLVAGYGKVVVVDCNTLVRCRARGFFIVIACMVDGIGTQIGVIVVVRGGIVVCRWSRAEGELWQGM